MKDIRNLAGLGMRTIVLASIGGIAVGTVIGSWGAHTHPNTKVSLEENTVASNPVSPELKAEQDLKGNVELTPQETKDLATKYKEIQVGWTKDQVKKLLGNPRNDEKESYWNYIPGEDPRGVKAIRFGKDDKVAELNVKAG